MFKGKIKTLSAFVVLGLSCCQPLVWADPPTQTVTPGSHQGQGTWIEKALSLTDSQKAQLKPILASIRQQMIAIRTDSTLTDDQKRQKMMVVRDTYKPQIDQILTPAQLQLLAALRMKWRAEHNRALRTLPSN